MLDTGLRVSELCGLDLDDIDFDDLSKAGIAAIDNNNFNKVIIKIG